MSGFIENHTPNYSYSIERKALDPEKQSMFSGGVKDRLFVQIENATDVDTKVVGCAAKMISESTTPENNYVNAKKLSSESTFLPNCFKKTFMVKIGEAYFDVNVNSLRKNFGISKDELVQMTGETGRDITKRIEESARNQMIQKQLEHLNMGNLPITNEILEVFNANPESGIKTMVESVTQQLKDLKMGELAKRSPEEQSGIIKAYNADPKNGIQNYKPKLGTVLGAYQEVYRPNLNAKNLAQYEGSDECQRHQRTVKAYYNPSDLTTGDARTVASYRQPTNIDGKTDKYDRTKLDETLGYSDGAFYDTKLRKEDNSSFSEKPNTVALYSETNLWDPIITKVSGRRDMVSSFNPTKKEVAVLSLPAPALDTSKQPHYKYYVDGSNLNENKYSTEMNFLFRTIKKAVTDNIKTAFEEKGIKRLVLSRFGQNNFLKGLSSDQQKIARRIFQEQLNSFYADIENKCPDLKVVMSEYEESKVNLKYQELPGGMDIVYGDILTTAEEGDFIVNAWDPHSAPGNGNDGDNSFDGAIGKGTGVLLTQTSWLNPNLRKEENFVAVGE